MNYRTLCKSATAQGESEKDWIGASDDESIKALNKAFDLGLNFVNTALPMEKVTVKNS